LLLPFTNSQTEIRSALTRTPRLARGTHLYDAAGQAITLILAAHYETGAVVLLSDGADTGSSLGLEQVRKLALNAHVRVFTVGLHSKTFRPAALQQLAAVTGGSFSEAATPADLAAIYKQLGLKLSNQYLVRYRSLVEPGLPVRVNVSIAGIGSARAAYTSHKPVIASYEQPVGNRIWRSWITLLVMCFLVSSLIGFGLYVALRPTGST